MNPLQFNLKSIKILRSEVRDHPVVFEDDFSQEDVDIEIEGSFSYFENYVQNFMHFQFQLDKKGEKNITLGHFDLVYTYNVKDLQENLTDEEFKKFLRLSVLSISYSTSRGVIFSHSKGFAIGNFYLPPVSPNQLYKDLIKEEEDLVSAVIKKSK